MGDRLINFEIVAPMSQEEKDKLTYFDVKDTNMLWHLFSQVYLHNLADEIKGKEKRNKTMTRVKWKLGSLFKMKVEKETGYSVYDIHVESKVETMDVYVDPSKMREIIDNYMQILLIEGGGALKVHDMLLKDAILTSTSFHIIH